MEAPAPESSSAGHPHTCSGLVGSWASQQNHVYPVRELGIPAGLPLPSQGAGHPSRTVCTWSGSWASQQDVSTRSGSWASQQDHLYPVRELGIPAGCLYQVRELGIPAGCLPSQGAGHPSRTACIWSGSWASQQDRIYRVTGGSGWEAGAGRC